MHFQTTKRDLFRLPHKQGKKRPRAFRGAFVAWVFVLLVLISAPIRSAANELKPETLAAWDDYIHSVGSQTEERAKHSPFLRISELPERRLQVQAGEIPVWREDEIHPAKVPHGLIHHWTGAVFIPKATIADVLAVTRDYDQYAEMYRPAVIESERLGSADNMDTFSMLLMQKVMFVTAAVRGDYEVRHVQVDPKHWYSISRSVRLQAVQNVGQPDMQLLPPDRGPGYVWRLYSVARLEESDGGVYVEYEALGLSRDIPVFARWLVEPVVEHLPRNSLHTLLDETRNAVLKRID